MHLRRYSPSGGGGAVAIAAVLGTSLLGGVVMGVVEGLVNNYFSLFVLFPLVIGLAAGGAATWMIGRQRLRAPLIALALGAIGGAGGYAAMHAVDYLQFRSTMTARLRADHPTLTDDDASRALDEELVRETGESGMRGWLEVASRVGISIKRVGISDHGDTFKGTAAWLIWLGELLFAAGGAAYMAYARAKHPFCEACNIWFGDDRQLAAGGAGSKEKHRAMVQALEGGDFIGAAAAFAAAPKTTEYFALIGKTCPRCSAEVCLTLKRVVTKGSKVKVTELTSWVASEPDAKQLLDAIATAGRAVS